MDRRLLKNAAPNLYRELDFSKVSPEAHVRAKSRELFSWRGNCGHEWEMSPRARFDLGYGCPYCSNQRVLEGFNDLCTVVPKIEKLWSTANHEEPQAVSYGSHKLYELTLSCGHGRVMAPNHLIKIASINCKLCRFREPIGEINKPKAAVNSKILSEKIIKEWDDGKNGFVIHEWPNDSNALAWWRCTDYSHGWKDSLKRRTMGEDPGCPYCRGAKLLPGFNDLKSKRSKLAEEWDFERNSFGPEDILPGSNKKVWWLCKDGHSWETAANNRTRGTGCPLCSSSMSKLEKTVIDYIEAIYSGVIMQRKRPLVKPDGRRLEIDIWVPELYLGFEVQDFATHSQSDENEKGRWKNGITLTKKGPLYHELKRKLAKEQLGITLVDIWEDTIRSGEFKERIFRQINR